MNRIAICFEIEAIERRAVAASSLARAQAAYDNIRRKYSGDRQVWKAEIRVAYAMLQSARRAAR